MYPYFILSRGPVLDYFNRISESSRVLQSKILLLISVSLFSMFLLHPVPGSAQETPRVLEMNRAVKMPRTGFIRNNVSFMESRDFGGTVIRGTWQYANWSNQIDIHTWAFSGTRKITRTSLNTFVNHLVTANFVKLTDNFVSVHCSNMNNTINWFGNSTYWNNILDSIEAVAEAANDAGIRGISLDCESYMSQKHFNYLHLEQKYPGNTSGSPLQKRSQWEAQVRLRGKQIMERMIQGYGSDFRLMFREGFHFVRQIEEINRNHPLSTVGANQYELVPAFVNGLLEGLSSNADIVELPEDFNSKRGIPSKTSFDRIWDMLKPFDGEVVTNPDYVYPQNVSTYNSRYKMGYMMWLDDKEWPNGPEYDGTAWTNNSSQLTENTWTPTTLRSWLKLCKDPQYTTAVYCVIWKGNYATNLPDWWRSGKINQQYVDVLNAEF